MNVIRVESPGEGRVLQLGRIWTVLEEACLQIPPNFTVATFHVTSTSSFHILEYLPDVVGVRIKRSVR